MITKHELKTYRDKKIALIQVEKRMTEIKTKLYDLRSPSLSGMPHAQQTESGSPQERNADKYSEALKKLLEYYEAEETELATECLAVEQSIDRLPQRLKNLMRAHYVEGMKWSEVSETLSYSWERCMQLHRRALDLIKNMGDDKRLH